MKKVLTITTLAVLASSTFAFAQTSMGDSNMSQAQKDQMARTQSRPEIKQSETKPPSTVGLSPAQGTASNPTTQSLSNGGGSGGSGGGR